MSASTDQDLIVETVIKAFFFVPNQAKGLDKLKPAVLSFAEGRVNTATARCDLRAALAGMGHEAYEDKLDCCLETAHAFVCGHVHWLNAQMNMDAYPACELCQMFQRDEIVDWKLRWQEKGGPIIQDGRMVALKNDLIWCRVSSFHLPFTPFELGSGMRLDGVHRTETIELGLLNEGGQPALSSINFDFENELRASIEMWLRKGEEE